MVKDVIKDVGYLNINSLGITGRICVRNENSDPLLVRHHHPHCVASFLWWVPVYDVITHVSQRLVYLSSQNEEQHVFTVRLRKLHLALKKIYSLTFLAVNPARDMSE